MASIICKYADGTTKICNNEVDISEIFSDIKVNGNSIGVKSNYSVSSIDEVEFITKSNFYLYDYAFYNCTGLKSVSIGEGLWGIYDFVFEGCKNLETIVLPSSLKTIGEGAFLECESLRDVNLPEMVNDIGERAFGNCYSITSITIPDRVDLLRNHTFIRCSSLSTINFGSGLQRIEQYVFDDCTSLKKVTIPDSVTYINLGAFNGCTSLEKVYFGNGIEKIDYDVFSECSSLNKIYVTKSELPETSEYTFRNIARGGTLYYPIDSGYSQWLTTEPYYLGYYGWNGVEMNPEDFPEDDPTDPDNPDNPDNPDDPNDPNNPNKPNKRPVSGDLDYIGCSIENLEYNYTGGPSQYVDITWSDRLVGYSVGVSHSWIKVYSKPEILSDGTYRYHITCEENIDTNYRSGSISFAADDGSGTRYAISLPVYQLGAAVGVVSASTTSFKVNSDGSPEYSSYTHIKGFYTAVNILDPVVDGDWIHLGEGVEYGGVVIGYDKRIDYPISFDANDGETRTGAVTFRGTDANGNTLTCVCVVTQIGKSNEDEGDDPTDTPESSSDTTFSPIWKDVEYEFAGDTVYGLYVETYYRLPGNAGMQTVDNLIFKGRAYAAPDELTVKVNINKICQNYMTDHPDIFDGAVGYYHNFQKFKLKNEYGTLLHTYYFVGDWSYEELELGIKTNPITPFLGAGQRLFFSALAQEQKGIKWGMYYTDGTPEYHNTEYVTNELQTNVVVASRNKNVGTFYFGDKMYSVVPKCQCKYVIYYMNPYGGFDWFAVTGRVSRKDTLQTYSISQNYNNTTTGFGKKRYLSTINVNYEVNTQWLTEEQSDRMWELIESNCVWLHNLTTDKIIPVVITDTEVEHKQKTNSKRMLSYTINMEHSQTRERF